MNERVTWEDGAAEIDYIDLLDIPEGKSNNFSIVRETKPAGFTSMVSNLRCSMLGGQPTGIVAYDHETTWTKLCEGDGTWMTDAVCEQEQHWRALRGFHGDVLVGGLGLGMAVRILEANPGVKNILVVEKEADVIDLVWPHVHHERATICEGDINDVVIDLGIECRKFDFAFLDTWASDGEATFLEEVVPLREAIYLGDLGCEVHCWNEDVMRGQLHTSLISRWAFVLLACHDNDLPDPVELMSDLMMTTGDKWNDWSAPFFRTIDEHDLWHRFDKQQRLADLYIAMFGMPGWRETWRVTASVAVGETVI